MSEELNNEALTNEQLLEELAEETAEIVEAILEDNFRRW